MDDLNYKPTQWVNGETPLDEINMQNIEDGIVQNTDAINTLSKKVDKYSKATFVDVIIY